MLNIRISILSIVLVIVLAVSFIAIRTGMVSSSWNHTATALDNLDNQEQTSEQHIMFHLHGYRSTQDLYPSSSN